MWNYLLRRLLLMIPTLIGITLITFVIIRLAPGEPAALGVGLSPEGGGREATQATEEILRAKEELLGLHRPLIVQYGLWAYRVFTFDFGDSWTYNQPIGELVLAHLSPTLQINILSVFVIYLISVPLGIGQAVRQGKFFDRSTTLASFLLYAAPIYWIGPILIIYLCSVEYLNWFPPGELNSAFPDEMAFFPWLKDRLYHLVLPVFCASYAGFAYLSKQSRASLLENLRADYVRTARAKGVSYARAILHHALRNSLIPLVTIAATLLPTLIGGSIILETIFSIRGMGWLTFEAILRRDYPLIMATTTLAALLTLVGLILQDLLYAWLDPRVSYD